MMNRSQRTGCVLAAVLPLAFACGGDPTPPARTGAPPRSALVPPGATPVQAAIALGTTPRAIDERGVPKLLQATAAVPIAPAKTMTDSARIHTIRLAPAWGVPSTALPALAGVGEVKVPGGTIVRLRQTIAGLPVDGGELRVLVKPSGELLTVSGALVATDAPRARMKFPEDDAGAIALAVGHSVGGTYDRATLSPKANRSDVLGGRSGSVDVQMARATKMWHRGADNILVPAWIVEAYVSSTTSTDGGAFRTIISNGKVLSHRSIVADATFNYRVFADTTGDLRPLDGPISDVSPHPTGVPDGTSFTNVPPALITVDSLATTGDPWVPAGRTETFGNNVDAYLDIATPSGFTFGDFRATTTAASTFDRVYNTALAANASQAQQMAGVTGLFYGINWLHDFWYNAGFTETAGNGQDNNFGRGGEDRDAILAEAQDFGGRNNANMSTPADGLPPRMQVFLWNGREPIRTVTFQPSGASPPNGSAAFGASNFNITADVILAADGAGAATDACTALTNNVTGKIVLVDRGTCSFKLKALNVQTAGGVGMLLANLATSPPPAVPGLGNDPAVTQTITIGSLGMSFADGATLKTDLLAGPVTGTMHRVVEPDLDGGNDATLLAHEFGHYLHHRLQQCTNTMCSALSEGWGDFLALMIMTRAGDDLDGAYPFGVYVTQSFSADAAYFGIRRAPYSADQAINSLSFRHMADGEALPTTHPFLLFGNNAEVHNAGEIWTAALWDGYIALQKAPGAVFDDVRKKMAQYAVSGLLLAPVDGTPTETRDAILAAAKASSQADHDLLLAAFAGRGLGSCAVDPTDRDGVTFAGIVDGTTVSSRALLGAPVATEGTSCDNDGVLDGAETARIAFPVANGGHVALTNASVTITSTTPGITVTSGPVTIASLAPGASQDVMLDVALDDTATTPLAGDFTIGLVAAGTCGSPISTPLALRLNVDDVPATSATDSFDTVLTVWTPTTQATPVWTAARKTALDGVWRGADRGEVTDVSLVSPPLTADATAPLIVTFNHTYSFELDFDGGVIEISTDNGVTFEDVITTLIPTIGYSPDPLLAGSDNVLENRRAFSGQNTGFPAVEAVTLDFGTQLAGQTFILRFRIGTDQAVGDQGWEINDLAFSGITGTPFPTQVADTGDCSVAPPDAGVDAGVTPPPPDAGDIPDPGPNPNHLDTGCCDAGPLRAGNGALALLVIGLLLRRRRSIRL